MTTARARTLFVAALAALGVLGALAVDASARRHTDYKCRADGGGVRLCGEAASLAENGPRKPEGPLAIDAPQTCRTNNVLVVVRASDAKQVREITLRLDAAVIETTTKRRPNFIGVGVDCAALALGEHTLTATLTRKDGTKVKVVQKLTRMPGSYADDLDD